MTGDRVKEQYYRNWIFKDDDGSWHFFDPTFEDHGPFTTYKEACDGVDDYLRRTNGKEDLVKANKAGT